MAVATATKTVTFVLATSAYQREAPTTMMRLIERLLQKGINCNVWCFEEAVTLTNNAQMEHMEPGSLQKVLGEKHSYVGKYVDMLLRAGLHGGKLDWVTCILCAQERGVFHHQMGGSIIGTLGDLWKFIRNSEKVICIPTYR